MFECKHFSEKESRQHEHKPQTIKLFNCFLYVIYPTTSALEGPLSYVAVDSSCGEGSG